MMQGKNDTFILEKTIKKKKKKKKKRNTIQIDKLKAKFADLRSNEFIYF